MFQYSRVIRFQDTDAAGVVYFAQILSICHEAYEASLQQTDIELKTFFSRGIIAVPITHAEADFWRPLMCGDVVTIQLTPRQTSSNSFEIEYSVFIDQEQQAAIATTRHVCIDTATQQRCPLTAALLQWLQWGSQGTTVAALPTDGDPSD